MNPLIIALTVVMGIGVGWSIGANDAANSLGTAVGSRVLKLSQAIVLIAIFGFLGAVLQGGHVIKTIGKGIVPLDTLEKTVSVNIALASCFSACAWVVIATYWKMPISTSHSIVGAVAGAGLAIGAPIKWKVIFDIFICWILTPLGAAVLGYIFLIIFKSLFYRILPGKYIDRILGLLVAVSGCYVAYTWGANDVANAVGVIAGAGVLSSKVSLLVGGLAIVLGIVTWGYKVIETIGTQITRLLPVMAFAAQLASSLNVHLYTLLGVPVSTSHSIVGAIFGVGLARGTRAVNLSVMKEIIVCWIATPFISGLVSFLILKGIILVVKL